MRDMEGMTERFPDAGEASYSVLARVISALYGMQIGKEQVYEWADRETVNARGEPFPQPTRVVPDTERRHGQPSRFWDVKQVIDWVAGGVPPRRSAA